MPQDPTKLVVTEPVVEADDTASQVFRTWAQKVSNSVPIVGSGTPEGVLEAPQYSVYVDETTATAPTVYRKMLTDIGGDRSKGWIDALTLSALTLDNLTVTNIYRDVGSGEGDKIGTPAASDWGWRDIEGMPQEPTTGGGKPSFSQIASSGVYTWNFTTGDSQTYHYHIPHDYVPGTDIYFHTHWFGPQTAGNYTKWQYDFLYAKGHNQAPFPTTATTVSIEQQQDTTAYQHMIAETAGVTISGCEVDGLIICKVSRIAPSGTDVSGGVFVPFVDLHYQSTNISTKNKAPNFYT